MKVTMVIPSYWARESKIGWQEGDAIYDHPTPLDDEGTLLRAIQSIKVINDRNFPLIMITPDIAHETVHTKAGATRYG